MSGKERYMTKSSGISKGFISTYSLAVFLYVISLIMIIITNDIRRMAVMHNMEEYADHYAAESLVIADIKNRLCSDEFTDGDYSVSGAVYSAEISSGLLYIRIHFPLSEGLTVRFDEETRQVLDYEVQ